MTYPGLIKSLQEDKLEAEEAAPETSPNEEDPSSETSTKDSSSPSSSERSMPVVNANDLVGRTFFLDKEGSQCLRDRIFKALDDFEGDLARYSSHLKFFAP